ncbi:MAG: hypothetical protein ACPGYV_06855 [Phycisphaeraceae bacterium]
MPINKKKFFFRVLHDRSFRLRGFAAAACMIALATLATPGLADEPTLPNDAIAEPERWLSDETFSEYRYGLTIRQPHDAARIPDTPQGDVMRWALPNGARISLSFARGLYEGVSVDTRSKTYRPARTPARVDLLKKQIGDELKATTGQVFNTRTDQVVEVGDLAGVINYYVIKPHEKVGPPYFYGVALLQLDDLSVAMLRMECPPDRTVDSVSTFECMIQSITVEPAKDVNRRLHGWLQHGDAILEQLTAQDRLDAMRDDRLYRITEAGRDLGYARVWQRYQDKAYYAERKKQNQANGGTAQLLGVDRFEIEGNAIVVQSRLQGRGATVERLVEAIDQPGEANGYWQIKNTMRYENDPTNQRAGTWVETGVRGVAKIAGRSTDHIQITREGTPPRNMVEFLLERERDPERRLRYPSADPRSYPSGDLIEKAWPTPRRAFLSFVDARLMPALLPREQKTYAFAVYHPETTRIDITVMRVEPNADGGKTVYHRPVLDLSEQTLVFDAAGELVSHTYPDGRAMKRTTRQELARIWGARLRD